MTPIELWPWSGPPGMEFDEVWAIFYPEYYIPSIKARHVFLARALYLAV